MLHGAACWFVGCAGCGLWALNVPVDVDATAPRALLLHFFMHCFVLASQREGGTGVRVCMCASVHYYIHTYVHAYLDPATWTAGCALCAVASAVKLCVSNVLCLQQSFTPPFTILPSPLRLLCCLCIDLHTNTHRHTLEQGAKV